MPPSTSLQFDFFPRNVQVQQLDPKVAVGAATRVQKLFTVRFEREKSVHQVFLDHHGWYCADHGKECPAVREAKALASAVRRDR
ncbi:MAG: hypothetical protein MNPFHGCM_02772 [Gemmatimonadaceae bacterium]|nr:hypothetical protein [Gemmatimonadaceae bacterium]